MLSFQKYCKGNLYQRRSSAKMTATNQVSFSLWDGEEVHYCHQLKSLQPTWSVCATAYGKDR